MELLLLEAVRTLEHGVDPIGFLAGTALIGNTALIKYLVEQNKKNKPHEWRLGWNFVENRFQSAFYHNIVFFHKISKKLIDKNSLIYLLYK